jgi:hydrogenase maturation protease
VRPVLVIGYGNDLLGDDAAGRRTVEAFAQETRTDVQTLSVAQLTPELADSIAHSRRVIFVDTSADPAQQSVRLRPIQAATHSGGIGHASRPGELLALAIALYGRCPSAWMMTLPGNRFTPGQPLSELAQQGVADALLRIRQLTVDVVHGVTALRTRARF